MKNRGRVVIALLFILSLIGISFYGGPVTYVFFSTVILVPVISYIYIWCVIFSLKIYQRTDGRNMVAKTPADFYITLQNEGWFSFSSLKIIFYSSFSSITDIDEEAEYELLPHTSITKKTKLLCRYRGNYNVGIKKIVAKDFFGLFSVTYEIKEPLNVVVAPALIDILDSEDRELLADASRDNLLKKTDPDISVREYDPGDDIRFINWKASAVMQKLMTRERHGEDKNGIAIIMDPGRYSDNDLDYIPAENMIIEKTLSLALFYAQKNIPADVILMTDHIMKSEIKNTGDMDELYTRMMRYFFDENKDMEKLLENLYEGAQLFGYRMLIFVTQKWTEKEDVLAGRSNTDLVPMCVYLTDKNGGIDISSSDNKNMEVVLLKEEGAA